MFRAFSVELLVVSGFVGAAAILGAACSKPCEDTLTCDVTGGVGGGGNVSSSSEMGGNGGAGADLGRACTAPGDCTAGNCVDGVCCESACDGACESCAVAASEGLCTPELAGTDPSEECVGVCDGDGACADGTVIGATQYGDQDFGRVFAASGSGARSVIAGSFGGTVDFAGNSVSASGFEDGFVVGLGASAAPTFATRIGGAGATVSELDVAMDASNNVLVTAMFNAQVSVGFTNVAPLGASFSWVVAKLAPTGTVQWAKPFAETSSRCWVAAGSGGETIVAGSLTGTVDFGGGALSGANDRVVVSTLDVSGNHLWTTSFFTTGGTITTAGVDTTDDGTIVVAGHFSGTVSFMGMNYASSGMNDVFVAEFTSSGTPSSFVRYGDADNDRLDAFAVAGDGSLQLFGNFNGTLDLGGQQLLAGGEGNLFTARFAPSHDHVWSRSFTTPTSVRAGGVDIDGGGNAVITGMVGAPVDLGGGELTPSSEDVFVAKFSGDGTHLWSQVYGDGSDLQEGRAVVAMADEVVVAGDFEGGITFGNLVLTAQGGADIFIARLAP